MTWIEKCLWSAAVLWAVAALIPASYWYDAHDTRIDDFSEGGEFELLYSGGPVRAFIGSYAVIVRNVEKRQVVGEDRSARFPYRVGGQRPAPLPIAWWAPGDARLRALPPGSYQMETCWTVHDAFWGVVPAKTTCSESNIFRVRPAAVPTVVLRWPSGGAAR